MPIWVHAACWDMSVRILDVFPQNPYIHPGWPWYLAAAPGLRSEVQVQYHYENKPVQIYWKFYLKKNENFQKKKKNLIFSNSRPLDLQPNALPTVLLRPAWWSLVSPPWWLESKPLVVRSHFAWRGQFPDEQLNRQKEKADSEKWKAKDVTDQNRQLKSSETAKK